MTSRWRKIGERLKWQLEPPLNFISGILLLAMIGTAVVGAVFPNQKGFYENITAEIMGVLLAVVIVGDILRGHQEKRELPARAAALRRVRIIHHDISRFWMLLVLRGARVDGLRQAILDFDDLKLFDERLACAINLIDLRDESPAPAETFMSKFVSSPASRIQRKIELVTQGYAQYLSPPILAALDRIENNPFIVILANDVNQRMAQTEALFAQPNIDMGALSSSRLDQIIGTHWYEDFIPAINELGRVIAAEIPAVPDPRDSPAPSDHQIRMSVGSQPPPAEHFDPECAEILKELRHFLRQEIYQSQQAEEAGDD